MATIKGKLKWNEFISFPSNGDSEENITFISNGMAYIGLVVYDNGHPGYYCVSYKSPYGVETAITEQADQGVALLQVYDEYRIMDFGEKGMDIDDELFECFVVPNAVQIYTVRDKLTQIAENEQKVYDAGIEKGKQAEYDAFWDSVQQNGNRTDYSDAFSWWGCEDLNPKYKIVPTYGNNSARGMIYRNANLKRLYAKDFDLSQLPNPSSASADYTFSLCSSLEVVEDVGLPAVKTLQYSFASNPALKQVDVIRVAEETTVKDLLINCPELITVNIEGTIGQSGINLRYSKKLSRASIESFIYALSDTASGQSITFSKAAVDEAFGFVWDEVDENGNPLFTPGSASQDWRDLEGEKTNWTITLV